MIAPNSIVTHFAALVIAFHLSASAAQIDAPGEFSNVQAVINSARPGDTVVLSPGHYREQLTVPAAVKLRSAGGAALGKTGLARAEATVIDGGGNAPAVVLMQGASIDGITVTGAGKFDQEIFDQHHAQRGENLADNDGAVGVNGSRAAIVVDGVDATVTNCIVHDNGHPGIGVIGLGRVVIQDNHVYRNMGGGIGIADGARGLISGNRCWMNLRAGIGCRNSFPTITGNHCYENVRAGIGIREGASPEVYLNKCYKNRRAGIGIRMEGSEPRIFANVCYENGLAGIGCRDRAAPIIFKNECHSNRLAGIGAMSNSRPSIVGNKLYGNEAAAIGLDACDAGEALILDNQIVARELVGIGIQSGWTVRVEGNEIERKGGMPPLVMVFEGARADFIGNTFTGSGVAAIRSQGQIFVCDNQFNCPAPRKGGPPQNAVWALEGSSLAMTEDNWIQGWRKPKSSAVHVSNRKELDAALQVAKPGTTILLAPGNYQGGLSARNLRGEKGKPITIAGAQRDKPPVFTGGTTGLHLIDPQYVELRNFVISDASANGINVDDGGSFDSPAQHVKLSGLIVRDIGGQGNRDGIKFSGVRDFRIENCRVERWGDGGSAIDMVGCHDGLVSACELEHREQLHTANGVQAKGGSEGIAIRRCHFKNAGGRGVNLGGSTGADYFRPADAKFEAADLTVADCFFEGSMAPIAFVGVAGASVRNNTILRPRRWIARILQENTQPHLGRCRDGHFERNFVAFRSDELHIAVNVGASTQKDAFRFVGNEWLSLDGGSASSKLLPFPIPESGSIFHKNDQPIELNAETIKNFAGTNIGVRWWTLPEKSKSPGRKR
ncbi:right-handed parallel beta-helix repeat-containing protein [bacterium]|nr:right-handed parallel beta-helix repeat-containing protein [bacterium]